MKHKEEKSWKPEIEEKRKIRAGNRQIGGERREMLQTIKKEGKRKGRLWVTRLKTEVKEPKPGRSKRNGRE